MKKLRKIIFGIVLGGVFGFFCSGSASAAVSSSDDSLYNLSLMQAVLDCYQNAPAQSLIDTSLRQFQSARESADGLLSYVWSNSPGLEHKVFLKTKTVDWDSNDGAVKCSDVVKNLKGRYQIPNSLEGLGYEPASMDAASTSDGTVEFRITNIIGSESIDDANLKINGSIKCPVSKAGNNWKAGKCGSDLTVEVGEREILKLVINNDNNISVSSSWPDIQNPGAVLIGDSPWVDIYEWLNNEHSGTDMAEAVLGNEFANLLGQLLQRHYSGATVIYTTQVVSDEEGGVKSNVEYRPFENSVDKAGEIAVYNMTGNPAETGWGYVISHYSGQDAVSYFWNSNDKYALYYSYLSNLRSDSNQYIQFSDCKAEKSEDGYYFKNSSSSWIKVTLKDGYESYVKSFPVSVLGNNGFGLKSGTIEDVLNALKDDSFYNDVTQFADIPCGDESGDGSSATTVTTEDGREIVDCDKFENIGAMQWVLCPTMNNSQYTANMLDNITEDLLTINADIYGSDSTTATVWRTVRDIANVLLVVFFSIVIISQLTGYGIDNYGIKKMLPRIIVMAIIVNLSLYICQITIDLSNILGVGLRDLFASFGNMFDNDPKGLSFVGGMITAAFASAPAVNGGAVMAGTAMFTFGAPLVVGILIAVIVALLLIIVALFVLFLMLGVRKIIVIVCVILSPLAFAAFILPNTQGLFKKWWDLFKAALIIFPICGFVSGISELLKSMAGDGLQLGVAGAIIMMVLPYAVFFLIPTLLKNAIAALGKMGGALTALGQTVRNGGRQLGQTAWNTAQKTEGFKNIQAEAARRRQSQSAQRTIDRLQRIRDNGGTLNERDTRRLARAHEIQRKLDSENTAARTVLTEQEYAGKSQEELVRNWNEAFDTGETEKMDALTNVIVSRHGAGGVNAIAKSLAGKQIFDESTNSFVGGDGGNMARSFNALQSNMMQNSALSNAMQNKASDVFQMISSGGYVNRKVTDADGNVIEVGGRANVATHAANNKMATQHKDWATQSTATLERAVTNGSLSQQTAVQILQSTDPTIQSGIQSDTDKRMVLQAAAAGYRGDFSDRNAVEEASQQYQKMDHEYIGKTAADVYEEATRENWARTVGVDSEYANKSADDVYEEAMRENREFNVREQDRAMRQAQAENIQEIRNSLARMTGGPTGGAGQAGNAEQNGGAGQSGNPGQNGGAGQSSNDGQNDRDDNYGLI